MSRPLGPDSDLVCSDLERNVSITTQLLREKPGGGPSGTRTSDRSCTVRHATQPHRLRFSIQLRPRRQHPGGVVDFVASNPGSTRATSRERGGSIGTRSPRVWPSYPSRESLRRPSAATRRPTARSWSKRVARQRSLARSSQARTARESPHLLAAQPGASPHCSVRASSLSRPRPARRARCGRSSACSCASSCGSSACDATSTSRVSHPRP